MTTSQVPFKRGLWRAPLSAFLLFAGCSWFSQQSAKLSQPIPLKVALAGLQNDLRNAALVSMQDAISPDRARRAMFETQMRNAQCFYQTADPAVPILVPPISLALQGTFTATGQFQVTATGPVPGGGIQGSAAQAESQQITLPMNFSILSHMPDVYMSQNLAYITGLPDSIAYVKDPSSATEIIGCKKVTPTTVIPNTDTATLLACNKTPIPNAEKTKLVTAIEANRSRLQAEVDQLISSYRSETCSPESKTSGGPLINNLQ